MNTKIKHTLEILRVSLHNNFLETRFTKVLIIHVLLVLMN